LEPTPLLTLPQLAETVGVEYRTLHSWLRRGLLTPSLQKSSGTGVPNLFDQTDAVKAKVIAELRQAGLSFEMLDQASASLDDHPTALIDGAMVLVNGCVTVADAQEAMRAITNESLTLVYNTRLAIDEIARSFAG
jgi:DNA-binding transcriptional MerR regulator